MDAVGDIRDTYHRNGVNFHCQSQNESLVKSGRYSSIHDAALEPQCIKSKSITVPQRLTSKRKSPIQSPLQEKQVTASVETLGH
jgi:hypothetical protein